MTHIIAAQYFYPITMVLFFLWLTVLDDISFTYFYVQAALSFTLDANDNLDAIQMKATSIGNNVAQLNYHHDQNHEGIEYTYGLKNIQRILGYTKISTNIGVPVLPLFFCFFLLGKEICLLI